MGHQTRLTWNQNQPDSRTVKYSSGTGLVCEQCAAALTAGSAQLNQLMVLLTKQPEITTTSHLCELPSALPALVYNVIQRARWVMLVEGVMMSSVRRFSDNVHFIIKYSV